jgi:hypothetical protein
MELKENTTIWESIEVEKLSKRKFKLKATKN